MKQIIAPPQGKTTITIVLGAAGGVLDVITEPLDPVLAQVYSLHTKAEADRFWAALSAQFQEAFNRFLASAGGTPQHAQAYADMQKFQAEMELVRQDSYYNSLIGTV